jgi:hypothetical protein
MIGCGLLVSTLIKMVTAAVKLVAGQSPRIHFVKSEAEAAALTAQLGTHRAPRFR